MAASERLSDLSDYAAVLPHQRGFSGQRSVIVQASEGRSVVPHSH